jgi:hypothetical protein
MAAKLSALHASHPLSQEDSWYSVKRRDFKPNEKKSQNLSYSTKTSIIYTKTVQFPAAMVLQHISGTYPWITYVMQWSYLCSTRKLINGHMKVKNNFKCKKKN